MMTGYCAAVIAEKSRTFTLQDKHVTLEITRNKVAVGTAANNLSRLV